jgi:hypothetical protein
LAFNNKENTMNDVSAAFRGRMIDERGSIPEWVMLLVMGVGIVMVLWAILQPNLASLVTSALQRLRG